MQEEAYRSKVGDYNLFMLLLLLGLAAMMIGLGIVEKDGLASLILILFSVPFLLIDALFLWFAFIRLKYVLRENCLFVRGFFSKLEIEYSSIKDIRESSDFGAVYTGTTALSMDQICIEYEQTKKWKSGTKTTRECAVLSPKDKEEFLRSLRARCGHGPTYRRMRDESKGLTQWTMISLTSGMALTIVISTWLIFMHDIGGLVYVIAIIGVIMTNITALFGFSFNKRVENNKEDSVNIRKYKTALILLNIITITTMVLLAFLII
ncbi:MAG: PH domain-containing protein [Methanomassiliicoccaceae archaeon]|nr:PH domain-containing protein [Methanomassiliicoccaceae archaeon]